MPAPSLKQASAALAAGELERASRLFQAGYTNAIAVGDRKNAGKFLSGLATVKFSSLQYKAALVDYLNARQLSEAVNDTETLGRIAANLSSLYRQMDDIPSALEFARRALEVLPKEAALGMRARWLMHTASLYAAQSDMVAAARLYSEGVREADRTGDKALAAQGWSLLGYHYLVRGSLANAEICLTEGFRLRSLLKTPEIAVNYRDLGALRLAQGDANSAVNLLSAGIAIADKNTLHEPRYGFYYRRALALAALGRNAEALLEFQIATQMARRWRSEMVPADAVRVGADVRLQTMYSDYIAAGMKQYEETRDPDLAQRMFLAAEENRAT
ncbi:MAG TPA: tetratricopeptide repeat protein, partial [Bryobacteraceae bacterium]|nr:tetratricopeptide repeat protein [Bryobacteraceae bacterium]